MTLSDMLNRWNYTDAISNTASSLFKWRSRCCRHRRRRLDYILWILSNNEGDSCEDLTWKVKSLCFKLYRAYSMSFNSSNVGIFFCRLILKDCIKVQEKKRKSSSCVHVLPKTCNYAFSPRSRTLTAKTYTKKRDARAEFLFCQSKRIAFFLFSFMSPSSFHELPKKYDPIA